ncbi:hypothetical protein [Chitinilyticum litopenaei]|uniref:hypothetical protein n=1 Tax=Chitinilyticum litopenaei TaxID=1121276 RepID=UPI0004017FAA|nr:hypothetical protein [Chitinilyticum litopenaei]
MKTALIAAVLATTLSGCAAVRPEVAVNGKLEPAAGKGYAILAVTLDSLGGSDSLPDAGIEVVGPQGRGYLSTNDATSITAPGNHPDATGKLHAVQLPAGDYTVTQMYGSWVVDIGMMRSREYVRVPLAQRFSVKAGEVVYLGDAHLSLNYRPSATLSNQQGRDFNFMQKVWKVSDTSNIQIKPLPAGEYTAQ